MKLVNENIDRFERGLDPKKAMGTGLSATILPLLKKLGDFVVDSIMVSKIQANRWEVSINVLQFGNKSKAVKDLDKQIKKLGLDHFLFLPAHNVANDDFANMNILYKFKPEFVGIFGQEAVQIEESIQFQRGLEPKAAMNIGVGAQLQKYAEEHYGIFADDFKNEYVDVLDHLVNMGGDPNTMSDEQKKIFINWLLPRMDLKYLDENIVEGLHDMEWNLVPYFKKLPDDSFKYTKTKKDYILSTSEWNNFVDYFQTNDKNSNYKEYITAVLSGDAYEYFQYDHSDEFDNRLDISNLVYHDPKQLSDILEVLDKLQFENKKQILNSFFRGKTSEPIFDFIWKQADNNLPGFEKLKYAIIRAASETIESANEYEAFKQITKQLCDHFDMQYLKNSVDLKFKITETGLNNFIYAYYLNDVKIRYVSTDSYGDFDVEVFHDCLDNALNN